MFGQWLLLLTLDLCSRPRVIPGAAQHEGAEQLFWRLVLYVRILPWRVAGVTGSFVIWFDENSLVLGRALIEICQGRRTFFGLACRRSYFYIQVVIHFFLRLHYLISLSHLQACASSVRIPAHWPGCTLTSGVAIHKQRWQLLPRRLTIFRNSHGLVLGLPIGGRRLDRWSACDLIRVLAAFGLEAIIPLAREYLTVYTRYGYSSFMVFIISIIKFYCTLFFFPNWSLARTFPSPDGASADLKFSQVLRLDLEALLVGLWGDSCMGDFLTVFSIHADASSLICL